VCEKERQADQVREELLAHLKREQIEPPARDRIRRIIGTALRQAEQALTARIASRVPAEAAARMLALIAQAADPGDEEDADTGEAGTLFGAAEVTRVDVFAAIRDEPGNVSVKTIGQEAFKLGAIRAVGLPDDLFADVAPKVLAGWRTRVAAEAPSHLRSYPHEIMVTLLAGYLYCRHREITDALVDLLIATVHRINARADTKVTSDFVAELRRVSGKENILFKMTEAAVESPGERVEDVIYPAVPGGHETRDAPRCLRSRRCGLGNDCAAAAGLAALLAAPTVEKATWWLVTALLDLPPTVRLAALPVLVSHGRLAGCTSRAAARPAS
jgi:hypothetical protein